MRHISACACIRRFGLRNSVFFAALLTTLLMGSATEAQIAIGLSRPMVTQPINEDNLVALSGNTRAEARVAANDQGALTDDTPMPHMMLQLRRPAAQEDAFNALIDQLHDPASPNYHRWLTAAEIGERFGPAPSDIQAATGWLSQHGFAVNTVYTNRMVIDFSGTAGQVRTAFRTEIHNLNVNGVAHFATTPIHRFRRRWRRLWSALCHCTISGRSLNWSTALTPLGWWPITPPAPTTT